jgi:signal transduction histidine kinase
VSDVDTASPAHSLAAASPDTAPFYTTLVDARSYEVLYASSAARSYLPQSPSGTELIGKSPVAWLGAEHAAIYEAILAEAVQMGRSKHIHNTPYRSADGRDLCFDWSVYPLHGSSGQIERLLIVAADVTLRRHAWEAAATKQRIRDLEDLNAIVRAVHAAPDWTASLDTLIALIQQRRPSRWIAISAPETPQRMHRALRVSGAFPGFSAEEGTLPVEGTFFEIALRERSVIYIEDIAQTESPLCDMMLAAGCHAFVHVPLLFEGQMQGVLTLVREEIGAFSPEDIAFFEQVGTHAAVALHHAKLHAERDRARMDAERQARREALVNAMSRAIISTLDPDEVIKRVIHEVWQMGEFVRVSLARPTEARGGWRVAAVRQAPGCPSWLPVGSVQIVSPEREEPARLSPVLRYRPDIAHDDGFLSEEAPALGIGSLLNVELWMEGRCLGSLNLSRVGKDAFPEEERATFESLAPFVALALHNADLYRSLKQTQEALVRAETLRAVGELASGVAHNINNLLAAVLGYAELIQMERDDPEAVLRDARIIEKAAQDGAAVVQRIQRFARQSDAQEHQKADIAALLTEALELTRVKWHNEAHRRGTTIAVESDLTPDLCVEGHPAELREVFVNLIRNACDAMPEGGVLTVRCRAQEEVALIEIADSGVGMDEETRRRVFEPFFTTKGVERGLGLGLSVSWGLVDRHGGRIEVQSATGRGALFQVRLPRQGHFRLTERLPERAPLHARVLLVEDEAGVRDSLARGLRKAGLIVHAVPGGPEALAWLHEFGGACEIAVCDHGLTGMTGLELLAELRCRYPHIRRVLLSGWGAYLPGESDASPAETVFAKPITTAALVAGLRSLPVETE